MDTDNIKTAILEEIISKIDKEELEIIKDEMGTEFVKLDDLMELITKMNFEE